MLFCCAQCLCNTCEALWGIRKKGRYLGTLGVHNPDKTSAGSLLWGTNGKDCSLFGVISGPSCFWKFQGRQKRTCLTRIPGYTG